MAALPCRSCKKHPAFGRGARLCEACLAKAGLLLDADGNRTSKRTEHRFAGRIRARSVHCGKDCTKCPHGYYLYLCWRVGKKARERYLGKSDSANAAPYTRPGSVPKRAGKIVAPAAKESSAPSAARVAKQPGKTGTMAGKTPAPPMDELPKSALLGAWRCSTTGPGKKRAHWVLAAKSQKEAAALVGLSVARFRGLWTPGPNQRRGHLSRVITERFGRAFWLHAQRTASIYAAPPLMTGADSAIQAPA